jgi:1,2-diacylglycerol 3-alpha-glucosyltransferase
MSQAELISDPLREPEFQVTNDGPQVAVLFYRIGPYHFARLRAAGAKLRVTAVEFSNVDPTYAWDQVEGQDKFERLMLFRGAPVESQPAASIRATVDEVLNRLRPVAVAIPGWYDRCSLAALRWCALHDVPAIIMSETTAWDDERKPWRELAGGESHAEYLAQLGMPRNRIFLGYDTVDNEHFRRGAEKTRWEKVGGRDYKTESRNGDGLGESRKHKVEPENSDLPSPISHRPSRDCQRDLPERFFLASARFVEKKNLTRLIQAYALYRGKAESRKQEADIWDLVLLGDGPLKADLCRRIVELGLQDYVHLPGFKQYADLPVYYGLASVFIHPSTTEQWGLVVNEAIASGLPVLVSNRCGCALDLVKEGVNGFTFDPQNIGQLAELMLKISALDFPLSEFGTASQKVAGLWGASAFGEGLAEAVATATNGQRVRATWVDRAFLAFLMHGVQALPGIDERMARDDAVLKSTKSERSFLSFSFNGRSVLAIPRDPTNLRRIALSRFQAYTPKRRFYYRLMESAMKFHCEWALARRGPIPAVEELGLNDPNWLSKFEQTLRLRLGYTGGHTVLAWPAQSTRKRLYLHLFTDDLRPFAFVKMGAKSEVGMGLKNGVETLQQLARLSLKRLCLPRLFDYGEFGSVAYTVLEPLPSGARPPRFRRDHDISPILAEFSYPRRSLNSGEIRNLSWWSVYVQRQNPSHHGFHEQLIENLRMGAEVCRAHGDMGLSNMVQEKDRLWLFDWESSHPAAPVRTDEVGYFLSFSVGKAAARPAACLRDFQRRFITGASARQLLDVMLALAFRFACGIPDADLYIRSWPESSFQSRP